jgi:transposase InsO family protein
MVELLLEERRLHPRWGPKKLIRRLSGRYPEESWPAVSTGGEILKRHGLVQGRPRRRPLEHPGRSLWQVSQPNDLWTVDFKGQFRTGDAAYCYPLTVADSLSRYLLGCRALSSTETKPTRDSFERLFRQYGLPRAIRSDNGTPFASTAIGRLSKLSVWWIRLGILPQLIQPAHPEQNGSHERMHRTLKQETTRPPEANRATQQKRFDRFREEYNQDRPHEALGQETPASLYHPSPRPYPARLEEPQYPGHFEVRRVGSSGCISWKGKALHLTSTLTGEHVALEETEEGIRSLYFGALLLGRLDEKTGQLHGTRTQ